MNAYDLLLFGATRNTGLHLAQQACANGKRVAAMVRPGSNTEALAALPVKLIEGDAFELADCQKAMREAQPSQVVSVLGGKNPQGRRVDMEGNLNVIRALEAAAPVNRFIFMTSMGCGEQYENIGEQARKFLGEALRAKTEAENVLRKSHLPWTIVRPGGLNNDPPSGNYCLLDAPDRRRHGYLSRTDVATALLKILEEEEWLHRIVTIQNKEINEG